jgi:threonine/homoserine/homoserine lactone efflux protein
MAGRALLDSAFRSRSEHELLHDSGRVPGKVKYKPTVETPMDIESLRRGIVIGFAIAAPVGPIGVLVIQRSLTGAVVGLSTGLGAATADAVYALVAGLATAFVAKLLSAESLLELAGGVALLVLGYRTATANARAVDTAPARAVGAARAFSETVLLTLANPATILSFAAVAASLGLDQAGHAAVFGAGVFAGSAAWWLLLVAGVRLASRRLTPRGLRTLHVASACIIAGFGVLAVAKAVRHWAS